jgi:hypothetical protein
MQIRAKRCVYGRGRVGWTRKCSCCNFRENSVFLAMICHNTKMCTIIRKYCLLPSKLPKKAKVGTKKGGGDEIEKVEFSTFSSKKC